MSAFDNFMQLQLAAILDDPEALVAIDKIAAELGPHATDAEREVVWQRMLKENAEEAEKAEKKEEPEQLFCRRTPHQFFASQW